MARNFLKSSLQNASFNIIFQILFRCVTFGLNAFVLRHVSQSVVGVMNVRLLLLESTILFLSREAFRRACLSKTTEHNWAQVINLLWLTVPLCQFFSFIFGYIWLHVLTPPSTDITQHYTLGVWAICLSCVIEMFCEPVYLVAQAFLFVRFKVVLDTIHIFVRTATFTPLIIYQPHQAVVAFSVAQVLAACVYTVGHYVYFHYYITKLMKKRAAQKMIDSNGKPPVNLRFVRRDSIAEIEDEFPFESLMDFLPAKIEDQLSINYGLSRLTWSFFKQGIMKQVLTEGERYIMTLFSVLTFSEQGVYDIVNNLGSLAARFLFRPIEESAYFYFSQMVARDTTIQEQNQKHMAEAANVLYQLLRCITCIGLVILVFGQSYSCFLLYLYGGESLIMGPGPTLMRTHCLAVLLLAINGITECYAFATMNAAQLDKYNYLMAILSVSFLVVSWLLTKAFGGVGFIVANCCNMAARIGHRHCSLSGLSYFTWELVSFVLYLLQFLGHMKNVNWSAWQYRNGQPSHRP
ncbi:protein RFT1 homolog isoform X2 [Zootermopsis nevadensis]|uniref:protein RFT1 homolog isoform X2 n=1 Tax=Zootermopsis nevadensis TaxID=136037 RepID=UPI000B8E8842|nr:protein RFT1 homolog isoform X2 [Zootermopsis nevadensis]